MTTKKTDNAIAVCTQAMATPQQKIDGGRKQVEAIKMSPDITKAIQVDGKADEWLALIDDWDINRKLIANLLAQLATARNQELVFARRFGVKKQATLGAITDFCDGSIDQVHNFGCGVFGRDKVEAAGVPQHLRDGDSKTKGTALAIWDAFEGHYRYQVQYAIDLSNPETFSEPVFTGTAKFKVSKQIRGATIHFRVATIDPKLPGGKSDWTAWVPVVVT